MAYHKNMKYSICNAVVEDIIQGTLPPFQIITEKMLSDRFGCSKAPVREALQELCSKRILKSIPRCGYQIQYISNSEVRDILQFRFALEGGMMRSCYQKITPEQLEQLEQLQQNTDLAAGAIWDHWAGNAEFHRTLMSFWNNSYAVTQLDNALDRLQMAYAAARIENWDGSTPANDLTNHTRIIQALREGSIEAAMEALAVDLGYFQELIRS